MRDTEGHVNQEIFFHDSTFSLRSTSQVIWQVKLSNYRFYGFIFPGVNGDIFRNQDNNAWYKAGVKLVEDNLKLKANKNTAKSAILFLGDGMGITTITATRFLDGQQKGRTGEENVLSWEVFPWSALAKTYSVNEQGTDSASSATALLSGVKTDGGKFKPYRAGHLACVASVSSRVRRESWDESKKKKKKWRGRGRGMKEPLARKTHDFEKLRSPTNAASDWRGFGGVD